MKTTVIGAATGSGLREFLQRELARRCADNPQYSLRAFARSLGVDHSTLSQILRGKRPLTAETIRSLAAALGLSADEAERFVAYEARIGDAAAADRHVRQLQAEAMETIAQWHHFAILELVRLESFRPDSRWIAQVLDISVDEVNLALTRLLHLGLLRMADERTWVDSSDVALAQTSRLPAGFAQEIAARMARLVKSTGADRVVSSSTLAVDRRRLPMIAKYLERVRAELAELLQPDGGNFDDVFRLDIFVYPLTLLNEEFDDGSSRDAVSDPGQEPRPGG